MSCVSTSVSIGSLGSFSLLKMSSPKPPVSVSAPVPPSITSLNGEPISRSSPSPPSRTSATMFTGLVLGSAWPIAVPSRLASIVSSPSSPLIVSVSPFDARDRVPDVVPLAPVAVAGDRADDRDAGARRIVAGDREAVVARAAVELDRVGCVVVRADVDADDLDARILEVADDERVGAAAEAQVDLVDAVRRQTPPRPGRRFAMSTLPPLLRDRDRVGARRGGDHERVAAAAAVDRREGRVRGHVDLDRVVAGAAVDLIARPARDDDVVAAAAVDDLVRRRSRR